MEEQIPEGKHSFHFTGLQVIPFQEYTYCVTANTPYGQIDLKLTVNFTELQGGLKCDSVIKSVNGSSYSYSAEGYHKLKQMFGNVIDLFPYAGFRSVDNTLNFITSYPCKIDLLLEYITCSHFYIIIEPHPPINVIAVIQCNQEYEIQIEWQVNTITCNNPIQLSVILCTIYLRAKVASLLGKSSALQPWELQQWCLQTDYPPLFYAKTYSVDPAT